MKFIILGCGSSMGVPRIDGYFGNCNPRNKKNIRTRCSAFLKTKSENILFDTSPDLRSQLLKNKILNVDKVYYSHMHADQTHGINELRVFYLKNKKPISVYANDETKNYLKKSFSYCFKDNYEYPSIMKLNKLKKLTFVKDGEKKIPIYSVKVKHGRVDSICYIIDKKLAYISDVSKIYKKDYKYFKKLNFLIIDCLRFKGHASHLTLDKTLELIKIFAPKKSILTNLHSDLDYQKLSKMLPKNVFPAFDGFKIDL